jgi:hypothetical protein
VTDALGPWPGSRRAYLGIGSNLGDRLAYLQLAVDELSATDGIAVVAVSPVYETAPVGGPEQPDYLNAVVAVDTVLTARELLGVAQGIEAAAERVRTVRGVRAPSTSTCCSWATSASTTPISWCRTRAWPSGRSWWCRSPSSTRPGARGSRPTVIRSGPPG